MNNYRGEIVEIKTVFLIPKSPGEFRYGTGQYGEIIGVKMVTPDGIRNPTPRLCYVVRFPDGVIDYVAISSVEYGHHKMIIEE